MSDNEDEIPQKRKKGVKNAHFYQRNVIKDARIHGKSYKNYSGKLVPAIEYNAHDCACKSNCLVNLATEVKKETLYNFLKMTNKDEQDIHLQRMMEFEAIKRKNPRVGVPASSRKPKSKTIKYNLLHRGIRKPVCKKAFLLVHGVTKKRTERLAKLLDHNKNPVDMRGKNVSGNTISPQVCQRIHDHIASFPTHLSHYTGTPTKYLDTNLSVATMIELYKKKFPHDVISYAFYWNYFKFKFNLRFGRPAKDCCGKCEELCCKIKNVSLSEIARKAAAGEWIVHKFRSKQFYNSLKDAKKLCQSDPKVAAISLDYMSNTSLPWIPVQELYYLRQLTVNTFGIHDLRTEKMVCYPYNEFEGRKGPNEVCSFLYDYIRKYVKKGVRKLILFGDNWGGQNKNHTLLRFAMALVELKLFDEVTINFPMRGHSYMPCDRDFGLIKRKLKKEERFYTLQEYHSLIKASSKIPDKFKVEKVQTKKIINFKEWWRKFYKKQCLSSNVPKTKFLISQYSQFSINKNSSGEVTCKKFINGSTQDKFQLRKKTKHALHLPKDGAYSGKIPILSTKMEDIKKIMDFIPKKHERFWNDVLKVPTRTETDIESGNQ